MRSWSKCLFLFAGVYGLLQLSLIFIASAPNNYAAIFMTKKGQTLTIVEYASDNITMNTLRAFDALYNTSSAPRANCEWSSYKMIHHGCCMVQFSMNYLYSMGFTDIDGLNYRSANIKTMTNEGNNNLGCYGINIVENAREKTLRFRNIRKKFSAYSTIMAYCDKHNISSYCASWLPVTYNLNNKAQRVAFFRQISCSNGSSKEWLLKTEEHAGKGVMFIDNINNLRSFYLTKQEQMESNPHCIVGKQEENSTLSKQAIAQQLILNTHEINGCKFHFRVWLFVASYIDPTVIVYADFVIYKAADRDEIRSNLDVGGFGEDLVLNMEQFAEYFSGKINVSEVVAEIKNISKTIFMASYEQNKDYRDSDIDVKDGKQYQHYLRVALDFIITTENQLKWLDFNSYPGTNSIPTQCFKSDLFGNNYLLRDKWQCVKGKEIMEEVVNLQMEIAIKKKKGHTIHKLDSIRNFDIILWK